MTILPDDPRPERMTGQPRTRWWKRLHFRRPEWNRPNMLRRSAEWDSTVYTLTVALGVPLMNFSVYDPLLRARIAMIFFAVATIWWILELWEMIGPVIKRGIVDEVNATAQVDSIQYFRNWAAQGALVIWGFSEVGYIVWHLARDFDQMTLADAGWLIVRALFDSPVAMAPIAWLMIVHTYIVGRTSVYFFPIILFVLSKAFPRGERIEEESVTVHTAPPRDSA